jgi:hypothetical protein
MFGALKLLSFFPGPSLSTEGPVFHAPAERPARSRATAGGGKPLPQSKGYPQKASLVERGAKAPLEVGISVAAHADATAPAVAGAARKLAVGFPPGGEISQESAAHSAGHDGGFHGVGDPMTTIARLSRTTTPVQKSSSSASTRARKSMARAQDCLSRERER